MRFLVLHGPNLNLLGERPGDDPSESLAKLDEAIASKVRALGGEVKLLQSNHEGVLIDALHRERGWADAVVLNPGALAHTSYALRDAITAIGPMVMEVHLTDLMKREAFRHVSLLKDVCVGQRMGEGYGSYLNALDDLAARVSAARAKASRSESRTKIPLTASVEVTSSSLTAMANAGSAMKTTAPGHDRRSLSEGTEPSSSGVTVKVFVATSSSRGGVRVGSGGTEAASDSAAKRPAEKTIGRKAVSTPSPLTLERTMTKADSPAALNVAGVQKTIGRGQTSASGPPSKTVGRGEPKPPKDPASSGLSRALVRQHIADRLSGATTPAALVGWARTQWQALQTGGAVERGQRAVLENVLQRLLLSTTPGSRLTDEQLVDLMAELDG